MAVAVITVFLATGSVIAAPQSPTARPPGPPADLSAVIALLKGGDATDLQKKQLVGKWYTGTVTVKDVVADRPDSPAQLIVAVKEGSRGNQDNFIEMSFEITDVERAAKLKKGSQATLTGQLVGTSLRRTRYMHIGDIEVFEFRNVTLAGASGGNAAGSPGSGPPGEITIPVGTLTIEKVEISDRFPPGCGEEGPGCSRAKAGFKVLVLWLKPKEQKRETAQALIGLRDVYVMAGDGQRTDTFSGGMVEGRHFMAFTPPEGSKNFILHWGKNAPVKLDR